MLYVANRLEQWKWKKEHLIFQFFSYASAWAVCMCWKLSKPQLRNNSSIMNGSLSSASIWKPFLLSHFLQIVMLSEPNVLLLFSFHIVLVQNEQGKSKILAGYASFITFTIRKQCDGLYSVTLMLRLMFH